MSGKARQSHERAHGPYRHGNRWRVVFVGANGAREVESFASEAEAVGAIAAARATACERGLMSALDEYLATRSDRERATARFRLTGALGLDGGNDRLLVTLTTPAVRGMWGAREASGIAGATLQSELGYLKRFGAFIVERGWLGTNPFEPLTCDAEVNRGKPKLRVNASKQLLAYLMGNGSLEATAVLTAFGLGLRASAVVNRRVEDLDDDGWLLWVRDDKTRAGDREIEVPAYLRERLLPLARDKHPNDLMFGDVSRHWLHYHTVRFCEAAGVPRVTPHGLRGSAASNAVRLGGSVEQVARALGHDPKDRGRTLRRHYLAPGAEESARGRMVESLVASIATPSVPHPNPDRGYAVGTDRDYELPEAESEVVNGT